MARRRKETEPVVEEASPMFSAETGAEGEGATATPPSDKPSVNRISLVIGADGTLDVASARPDTKQKLRQVLADPRLATKLGVEAPADLAGGFGPGDVALLLRAVGMLQVSAARLLKVDSQVAGLFAYSDAEVEALSGPGARVLNKYAPGWMAYKDETALVFTFVGILQAKVVMAQALMRQKRAAEAEAEESASARPNGSAAIHASGAAGLEGGA